MILPLDYSWEVSSHPAILHARNIRAAITNMERRGVIVEDAFPTLERADYEAASALKEIKEKYGIKE